MKREAVGKKEEEASMWESVKDLVQSPVFQVTLPLPAPALLPPLTWSPVADQSTSVPVLLSSGKIYEMIIERGYFLPYI